MSGFLPIVTIDGPSGVGKSTLAGMLAARLDIPHLDTGAMFRKAALALGPAGSLLPAEDLRKKLADLDFDLAGHGCKAVLVCNGKKLGDEIRTEQVGLLASGIAKRPEVRDFMKSREQDIGARHALIADGRDTGSEIFPDAGFKFFLDANPHARALRRKKDLEKIGQPADLAAIEKDMFLRDYQDRNRKIAPLRPTEDAAIIDTSDLSLTEVFEKMLEMIRIREQVNGIKLTASH